MCHDPDGSNLDTGETWRVGRNNIKLFYKEEGKEHQRKKGNPSLRFHSAIIKMYDYGK